jgi:prepilin-type N-terminal cleavage/methylation domain-containing protein
MTNGSGTRIIARTYAGFTLVELLVVLFLLVILSAVAVQSLTGVQDQTRYQATQRGLANIRNAVLGPANQFALDQSPLVTGFVADNGRLPLAVGTDPRTQFQELWLNSNSLQPFGFYTARSDSEVIVPCGWRGDYMQLDVGTTTLTDGWGNPYDFLNADNNTTGPVLAMTGVPIEIVRSDGSDGVPDTAVTNDYTTDVYLTFYNNSSVTPNADNYHASISGNVFMIDSTTGMTVNQPIQFNPADRIRASCLFWTESGNGRRSA